MAEVWLAEDTKLGRAVAVKLILAAHASDPGFLTRFLREARLVASLEHPNILPVYDFGEEEGAPFLVMPYLEGGTLRDRMLGGPTPLPQASLWVAQLAGALDAAHEAGVLHRDVKPANVLIGKGDRTFLADFGIAKMLDVSAGLTTTGMVVGTPLYMAPEQAQGHPATAATDRYALAVIAWELLAGKPPFEGESPLSLMHQHVTVPPPALSTRMAGLPQGLDDVFARALAKDPRGRHETCTAFAAAVQSYAPGGAPPAAVLATAPTVLTTPRPGPTAWTASGPSGAALPRTVATPPPGLTSDQTVVTEERRRRGRLPRGLAAGLVALGAVAGGVLILRGREREKPAPIPVVKVEREPAAAPVPTTAPAAPPSESPSTGPPAISPSSFSRDAEAAKIAALEARLNRAERELAAGGGTASRPASAPPTAVPTPAAAAEEAEGQPESLLPVVHRLDPSRKPEHRLARADFEYALAAARDFLKEHPNRVEARYLELYAAGGLEYVARQDAAAGRTLVQAVSLAKGSGRRETRALAMLLLQQGGRVQAPTGWALALAYGDARGEAEELLKADLASGATPRALLGRASLRRIQGRSVDAIADAKRAYDMAPRPAAKAGIAEFIGDECARGRSFESAVAWYRIALRTPGPTSGAVALRAARILRDKLGQPAEAQVLLKYGCDAGNAEACREAGQAPPPGGPRRAGRN